MPAESGWDEVGSVPFRLKFSHGSSGDGNLTRATLHPGAGQADRVTTYGYDWRDRQTVEVDGTLGSAGSIVTYSSLDNWGLTTSVRTYAGDGYAMTLTGGVPDAPAAGKLRSLESVDRDELGRAYRWTATAVDPASGATGASSSAEAYYDGRGDVTASRSMSGLWTTASFDGAGRETDSATGQLPRARARSWRASSTSTTTGTTTRSAR